MFTPIHVAQRTDEELSHRKADEAEGDAELQHGGRSVEIPRHSRESRQIEVGYKRAERRNNSHKDEDEEIRISSLFVRHYR